MILRCGSSIAVWSIMACAASGTAASSGVIFRPDAVVMMASGKSLAAAMRLTVASCASNNSNRSCRYWSQSVATASGNSLASFKVANFSTGTRYSSKSLNWREPCTQTSPERSAFLGSVPAEGEMTP